MPTHFESGLDAPLPSPVLTAIKTLQLAGFEAFLVGGCVRDKILGRPFHDFDVTTNAHPEQVIALFEHTIPTGIKHGTVTSVIEKIPIEITTYRIDVGYSDGRHPDQIRFTPNIVEDLARRDFTINAMAFDPIHGQLIDPFDGQGDLKRKIVKTVGNANARFGEDGLRPMRAVRFAAVLGFEIEQETQDAIPQTLEIFRKIASERIRVELVKILQCERAAKGIAELKSTGLMGVFLNEIAELSESEWARTLDELSACPKGLCPRLAILLSGQKSNGEAILKRLHFSNSEIRQTVHLLSLRDDHPDALNDAFLLRKFVAKVGRESWADFVEWRLCSEEKALWKQVVKRVEDEKILEGPLTVQELPIDGQAVMQALHLPPSRKIGEILEKLLHASWQSPNALDRQALLDRLKTL